MNHDPEPSFELVLMFAVVSGLVIFAVWVLLIPVWVLRWTVRKVRS